MSQLAQVDQVPSSINTLWQNAEGISYRIPTTRPGSTWSVEDAKAAAELLALFYAKFTMTAIAEDLITMRGGTIGIMDPYWPCDSRLCDVDCVNLPSICSTTTRKWVVENFLQWLGLSSTTKEMTQEAIGTDTTLIGVIFYNEPTDKVRLAAARTVGSVPMNRMLLKVAGKPNEYTSWTVNALLSILNGWPAKSGAAWISESPSYDTVSSAIAALTQMTTRLTPMIIRQRIGHMVRTRMTDNMGRGGGLDIRNPGDRPGPWSQSERNKLYFEAVQLDAHTTDLPEAPPPPDPIPNPWQPGPDQIPDPSIYPPPAVGIFGKQTNLIFGIAAGVAVFAGAGTMLWLFKRGHGRRPTPVLRRLGNPQFQNASSVRTYVRRR